jgi:hypothetical protein
VTLPDAVGATVAEPLADWLPLKAPPTVLDVEAVHAVAFVEAHVSLTACPKLIVVACAGELNIAVGICMP